MYYITNRTIEQRFWLKNDADIIDLAETWLARAALLFGIKIYFFIIMDNHFHLAISSPLGKRISNFMAYFKSRLAWDINRIRGREGPLWKRRFDAAPILDAEAALERLAYTLLNPVAAHMCRKVTTSPVPSAARMILCGEKRRLRYFDRSAWHRAGKPKDKAPFFKAIELKMEVLPALADYDEETRTAIIQEAIANHPSNQKVFRCAHRNFAPRSRPKHPKRSPRVICHASSLARYQDYIDEYKAKVAAYYRAARQYIQGYVDVLFPEGMFPPSGYPLARHAPP